MKRKVLQGWVAQHLLALGCFDVVSGSSPAGSARASDDRIAADAA